MIAHAVIIEAMEGKPGLKRRLQKIAEMHAKWHTADQIRQLAFYRNSQAYEAYLAGYLPEEVTLQAHKRVVRAVASIGPVYDPLRDAHNSLWTPNFKKRHFPGYFAV